MEGLIAVPVDNKLVLYDEERCRLVFQNDTGIFEISPQTEGKETLFRINRVDNKRKEFIGIVYQNRRDKKLFSATDTVHYGIGRDPFQSAASLISKIKKACKEALK